MQREQHRADPVDVRQRIQREPPEHARGRIAEPVGRPRVRGLVKRQRQDQDDERAAGIRTLARSSESKRQEQTESSSRSVEVPRSDGPRRRPWRRRRPRAPRGWRAARRRPIRTPSAAACAAAAPMPAIVVQLRPEVALRPRDCRWNVTANRCASSRIRCSSRSAGDSRGSARPSARSRVKISSSCLARPTATSRSRPSSRKRRVGRGQLPLAAVDQDQIRKRPALLEHAPIAAQHDLVHGGEVVRTSPAWHGRPAGRCAALGS